jgi:hypothetical protein
MHVDNEDEAIIRSPFMAALAVEVNIEKSDKRLNSLSSPKDCRREGDTREVIVEVVMLTSRNQSSRVEGRASDVPLFLSST